MTHSVPDPPVSTPEPVLIAHAVTTLLVMLGGLGWFVIPNQTINAIGDIVLLLVATVGALIARGKVKPVGDGTTTPSTWADIEDAITQIATTIAQQQIDDYVAKTAP